MRRLFEVILRSKFRFLRKSRKCLLGMQGSRKSCSGLLQKVVRKCSVPYRTHKKPFWRKKLGHFLSFLGAPFDMGDPPKSAIWYGVLRQIEHLRWSTYCRSEGVIFDRTWKNRIGQDQKSLVFGSNDKWPPEGHMGPDPWKQLFSGLPRGSDPVGPPRRAGPTPSPSWSDHLKRSIFWPPPIAKTPTTRHALLKKVVRNWVIPWAPLIPGMRGLERCLG